MALKYTFSEKEIFLQVLGNYPIVEDKKTDAMNIERKRKAWAKITEEFNAGTSGTRTTTQLKRLWDKMKRSRKGELAEERRELLATGGGPPRPPPPPQPALDNLVPHIEFEMDVVDDSDGIKLIEKTAPGTASSSTKEKSESLDVTSQNTFVKMTPTIPRSVNKSGKRNETDISQLTNARLALIRKEEQQMDELHKIRLEEAIFQREAARLQMLQEELKLKKMQDSLKNIE